MTVFANVLKAPVETDEAATREDILTLCRRYRVERVARMKAIYLKAECKLA